MLELFCCCFAFIGTAIRPDQGRKYTVKGSERGLTMTWPIPAYAGSSPDQPILIVEGQTDAAAGLDLGFITIGRPSATGGLEHLKSICRDKHMTIIGENDGKGIDDDNRPGKRGAEKIAVGLLGIAASVRIIYPPAEIKDLREWTNAPAPPNKAELLGIIQDTPEYKAEDDDGIAAHAGPMIVALTDVSPEPVRWLWPERIARGKLTIIAGDPGLGKSFLTLDMAARVSTGGGFPDLPGKRYPPAGVVLLSAEDDIADTVRPRLDAAGADVSRIIALQAVRALANDGTPTERSFDLSRDLRHLEQAIQQIPDCRLVIIDPISAYLGATDSHKNADIRGLLAPLSRLAAEYDLAVVAITHLRKGEGAAIYRAMGSLAFVAAARAGTPPTLADCCGSRRSHRTHRGDPARRRTQGHQPGEAAQEPAGAVG